MPHINIYTLGRSTDDNTLLTAFLIISTAQGFKIMYKYILYKDSLSAAAVRKWVGSCSSRSSTAHKQQH